MPKRLHEGGPMKMETPQMPQGSTGMGSSMGAPDMSQATDARPVPVKGSVKGKRRGGRKS